MVILKLKRRDEFHYVIREHVVSFSAVADSNGSGTIIKLNGGSYAITDITPEEFSNILMSSTNQEGL